MELVIHIKMDLALNNQERLIYHKTQQSKPNQTIFMSVSRLSFMYLLKNKIFKWVILQGWGSRFFLRQKVFQIQETFSPQADMIR